MTLFGLDTPWPLFAGNNETMRSAAQQEFVDGLNGWLAEPLEDCLAVARDGSLCIEGKSPVDIEEALGLYHGNIFQNALTFPFAEKDEEVGSPGASRRSGKMSISAAPVRSGAARSAAFPDTMQR